MKNKLLKSIINKIIWTMKKLIFTLLSLSFSIHLAEAQNDPSKELSSYINQLLQDHPVIPAVSVAVVTEEGVQLAEGFGTSDLSKRIAATKNTNFYMASVTKSFNGLLATILSEEGMLDLNKPITAYRPFKDFENKKIFEKTSIQDLLSHTSGLKAVGYGVNGGGGLVTTKLAYYGNYTDEEVLDIIANKTEKRGRSFFKRLFNQKSFGYTNFGYYLFDAILQEEFNKSWKDMLKEKVFDPLEMTGTTAYLSQVTPTLLAKPYSSFFPEAPLETNAQKTDKTMHAAGGLVSNANDMAHFLSFYINEGKFKGQQVYPKALVRQTYAKQISASHNSRLFKGTGYGTGWRLGDYNGEDVVYHFGGYKGWFAHLSFLPERKVGVVVFVNHDYGWQVANLIATKAYNLFLGKSASLEPYEKILSEDLEGWVAFGEGVAELNRYSWNLSLPKTEYTGTFNHTDLGKAIITYENGELYIELESLKEKLMAHPEKDHVLAELYSHTRKKIFFITEGGEVKSLSFDGLLFTKVN